MVTRGSLNFILPATPPHRHRIPPTATMAMTAETAAAVSTDPILAPNPQRFVLFPIKYHQVWEMYKKHEVTNDDPSPAMP